MDKIEKALYLINNSKLNEAQRVLNDVIIKSPKDFNAIHLTGIIYAKKKEFKIALNFFDKALEVNPKSADACHNRGNALRELKEFDKAILDIEKAIQLNKDDSLIAGTNLFDKGNNNQSLSPSIDLTPMITAINEVKSSIDRLYSKNTTISMDGKAVGTTLTQNSYKLA